MLEILLVIAMLCFVASVLHLLLSWFKGQEQIKVCEKPKNKLHRVPLSVVTFVPSNKVKFRVLRTRRI